MRRCRAPPAPSSLPLPRFLPFGGAQPGRGGAREQEGACRHHGGGAAVRGERRFEGAWPKRGEKKMRGQSPGGGEGSGALRPSAAAPGSAGVVCCLVEVLDLPSGCWAAWAPVAGV